jgi:hypothetical protein
MNQVSSILKHASRWRTPVLGLVVAGLLSACGGGDDDDGPAAVVTPPVTESVPTTVQTNATAATTYVQQLSDTNPTTTDQLEPVSAPAVIAADDTAEPS